MTESSAATLPLVKVPRLSLEALRELRCFVDAQGLSSLSSGPSRTIGGDDGTTMATTRSDGPRSRSNSAPAVRSDSLFGSHQPTQAPSRNAAPWPQGYKRQMMMNKITTDHLARSAYLYVRQSTSDQLVNNPESRRRQYALASRARTLGWQDVVVIDDDLGRSGGGTAPPDLNACWPQFVPVAPAPCWRSRLPAWRAMAAIGIRFWSSARW